MENIFDMILRAHFGDFTNKDNQENQNNGTEEISI